MDGREGDVGQWYARVEETVSFDGTKSGSATGRAPFVMLCGAPSATGVRARLALVGGNQDSERSDESEEEARGCSGGEAHDRVWEATEGNREAIRAGAEETQGAPGAKNRKE